MSKLTGKIIAISNRIFTFIILKGSTIEIVVPYLNIKKEDEAVKLFTPVRENKFLRDEINL